MGSYELTKAADADFENIFDYGIDTFGIDQALKYQSSLKQRFDEIAEQPKLYPSVDDIRQGITAVFMVHIQFITVLKVPRKLLLCES